MRYCQYQKTWDKEDDGTHSFRPETPTLVHHVKELFVLLAPEPVQASNLEVAPEMAHVVGLAFHRLGVNLGHGVVARFVLQDLFGQLVLLFARGLLFLLRRLFEEHLPQAFRRQVVLSFVGGRVAEDIRDGLAKFFDRDRETVSLVGLGHLDERIATGQ